MISIWLIISLGMGATILTRLGIVIDHPLTIWAGGWTAGIGFTLLLVRIYFKK